MASSNPQGEMQFWFQGLPFGGIKVGTKDAGEMQFWFQGHPIGYIFPTGTPPATRRPYSFGVVLS